VRLPLGQLLLVIGAAVAVPVPDLGDRGHVDGVVDAPVAAQRQSAGLPVPGGRLDRGGAVIGGEVIASGEAATSVTSPMMVPATTGPAPKTWVRVVPETLTAAASFLRVSRSWASRRRRSARKSAASSARAWATAPDGAACSRILAARGCRDLLRKAAGDQVAEHGVPPAGNLVAGPAQVPVPLSPHLQHRRVVIGGHRAAGPGPQRRDRHRQGIIRIVLIRVTGLQQAHPASELRLHVQHPLARRDQLPGQQPAQPAGTLHRPGPLRPHRRPREQLPGPGRCRRAPAARPAAPPPSRPLPPCASPCAGPRRSSLPPSASSRSSAGKGENVAGMPNSRSARTRTSFEPRHGETRQAGTSF
jgi:hypothetical protein